MSFEAMAIYLTRRLREKEVQELIEQIEQEKRKIEELWHLLFSER